MGKHKKVRRVSTKTKDSWELTGNRAGTIKVVDLETGEEGSARFIVDVDKDEYKIECRRCKKWGTYSLNSITDNQRTSGLCPNCYKKENQDNFYGFGKTLDGQWVQIGDSQNEESWFLSKSEINRIKKLKYPGIDLKLVKCPPNPFEKTEELLFVDNESDYGKAIQNRKIEDYVAKIKAFEKWKKTYPEECIELLSWSDDEVSENNFLEMFPHVKSPTGKKVKTSFLKSIREHCQRSKAMIFTDWQGFEFGIRDTISRWNQLDPRRYLIFKLNSRQFCYREIDALGLGSTANIVIDAKWCGGEIKKSQMELYMRFLNKIGIDVTKGVFVTADDEFEDLGDNIFRMPLDWFQLCKSIDNVDLFWRRIQEIRSNKG